MEFNLINGTYSRLEALEILSRMVQVKIEFHEDHILHTTDEEDRKMREQRIKELHSDLLRIRKKIEEAPGRIAISATVKI
jgi:hypothetical protein